jgi:FkbM family methyltransferase
MITIEGLQWPDDVGEKWRHSFRHVTSIEWAIARCKTRRVAVQAGGNIGLWPRRLAQSFERVITFEPEPISRACLRRNVPANVDVRHEALGQSAGSCAIERRSLGSHRVIDGSAVWVLALDALRLTDVDLIQLDIEGYEWHALMGATDTIQRCRPVIQVELRDFTTAYGASDAAVRALLASFGYVEVSAQPGNDFVFEVAA